MLLYIQQQQLQDSNTYTQQVQKQQPSEQKIPSAVVESSQADSAPEEIAVLEDEFVKVRFTNKGGAIKDVVLPKFKKTQNSDAPYVFNANDKVAALSLAFETLKDGTPLPFQKTFKLARSDKNVIAYEYVGKKVKITRAYSLAPSNSKGFIPYVISTLTKVENISKEDIPAQDIYLSLGMASPNAGDVYGTNLAFGVYDSEDTEFFNSSLFVDSKGFLGIGSHKAKAFEKVKVENVQWGVVKNQFFATVFTPTRPANGGFVEPVLIDPKAESNFMKIGLLGYLSFEEPVLKSGESREIEGSFYVGPKELENLVDWNLSRSRYWGTPLPIWCSEDGSEQRCIGSVAELMEEIEKSIAAGFMKENPFQGFTPGEYTKENYNKIDLHRPYVDDIVLVSPTGQKMYREKDLIDVWFDSGAMPYAQLHYPFEHKEDIDGHRRFPADFIAEGVDQTRGWFFTLHAIATMAFDSVAFKNIISNGLVLDAKGNKMSKRLGNAVDPFETIEKYGSDPLRWYMITNSQPWDNLKFDLAGVDEVKRKFFGTLYNTYGFFALYANVDHFRYEEADLPVAERPEIDRWILSLLNSLIKEVTEAYEKYEPTRAGRAIQDFVIENLSNWYVRLSRKRYWGGEYSADKISAYQTLYTCLETVAILASPIAPFYTDKLFGDLNSITRRHAGSVHLTDFPKADETLIDKALEERMTLAQQISSMVLGLRRKVQLRVRQPLSKLLIPILHEDIIPQLDAVKNIILSEVNVKEIEYITDTTGVLVKRIKPNFKTLGPKYGKYMKQISARIAAMEQGDIFEFEKNGSYTLDIEGASIALGLEDVEILSEDIPGWLVANEGRITVALDINVTKELKEEGIARELINRIQNLRKESNFDVTDKIRLTIGKHPEIDEAVEHFASYIAGQVLAEKVELADVRDEQAKDIEIDEIHTFIKIEKQ